MNSGAPFSDVFVGNTQGQITSLSFTINITTVAGCTSATACNYNASATSDDGSCVEPTGCQTCSGATDGTGTVVDNDSDSDGVCDNADACAGHDDNADADNAEG